MAYRRLRLMKNAGYMHYRRLLADQNGVYFPTRQMIDIAEDTISPIKDINLSKYMHDNLFLWFILKNNFNIVSSERELRQNAGFGFNGQRKHIPDATFYTGNGWGDLAAIEFEITEKSSERLKNTLRSLSAEYAITIYFVDTSKLKKKIEDLVSTCFISNIKVIQIDEHLMIPADYLNWL